jgi:hypothetical protein
MLLLCFIIVLSGDTSYHGVKVTSVCIMCIFLVNVSMNCWCLLEPSSAFMVIVWDNLVWVHESGFATHLGTYISMHHRWMLPSTIGFFV